MSQILYGMSLGGALAIDLASRNPNTVRLHSAYSIFPQPPSYSSPYDPAGMSQP
jgi:dienelactone hydrolase